MTCPAPTPAQLAALRAEFAAEKARAEHLAATVRLQAQSIADLTAYLASRAGVAEPVTLAPSRPPSVTRNAPSVTAERDALRPQRDGASVTRNAPSVTDEEKTARARDKNAARQRAYRLRKANERSVTDERDGVTPSVTRKEGEEVVVTTLPPSSVTHESVTPVTRDAPPSSGRLRLQGQLAAKEARSQARAQAEHAAVPPRVWALREGWQRLVVGSGRGFAPWPERMSAAFIRDAQAALQRHSLEVWLEVFALVPRSPVCRGELRRKRHVDVLFLLVGKTGEGREPAEMLLTRAWSVDPEVQPPASGEETKPEPLAAEGSAEAAWARVLASVGQEGRRYTLDQLQPLRPRELVDGALVLVAPDRFRRTWTEEHYSQLLREHAARCGLTGVRVDVEGGP